MSCAFFQVPRQLSKVLVKHMDLMMFLYRSVHLSRRQQIQGVVEKKRKKIEKKKMKVEKRKKKEERKIQKKLLRLRLMEEKDLSVKIAMEERKLLIAQRKLESIRLLDELFERVKVNSSLFFSFSIILSCWHHIHISCRICRN